LIVFNVFILGDIEHCFDRSVVQACPKLELNDAQTAVLYTRAESEWPSDDEENGELKGTKWDSEGVGNYYNQYYKLECPPEDECWDIEMEGEREDDKRGEQDTWSSWRGTNVPDDCEHEGIAEDIFADHNYTC
jgi:hypothetical protein